MVLAASACTGTTAGVPHPVVEPTGQNAVTVARPGYEGLPPSIADPAALVSGEPGAVVSVGAPVVQACGLVRVEDIRAAGGLVWPNGLAAAVERRYFDGRGAGVVVPVRSLPAGRNVCRYPLMPDRDRGFVEVEVAQPGYATPEAISARTRGLTVAPTIGGADVYTRTTTTDPTHSGWVLAYRDTVVDLDVRHPDPTVREALVEAAAQRLVQFTTTPEGPRPIAYDSPTWTGTVGLACAVLGNAEFRAVFGVDASPIVREQVASAIGVVAFDPGAIAEAGGSIRSGELLNYVDNTCVRRSVLPGRSDAQQFALSVTIHTYETADAAHVDFHSNRRTRPNQVPVPTQIGDETLYSSQPGRDHVLSFRRGRLVIELHYEDPTTTVATAAERIRVLTPVATAIAEQLRTF